MFLRSRNSHSASAASRNSSASSASSMKTLYVINHLRDVEGMLTSMPPVMATLKLTISYLEMTFSSIRSFPDFLKSATNLMTSNLSPALAFGKLFISRSCQPWVPTSISVFTFSSFLIPFWLGFILPKLSGSRIETKAKQKCSSSNSFKPWSHYLPYLSLTWLIAL